MARIRRLPNSQHLLFHVQLLRQNATHHRKSHPLDIPHLLRRHPHHRPRRSTNPPARPFRLRHLHQQHRLGTRRHRLHRRPRKHELVLRMSGLRYPSRRRSPPPRTHDPYCHYGNSGDRLRNELVLEHVHVLLHCGGLYGDHQQCDVGSHLGIVLQGVGEQGGSHCARVSHYCYGVGMLGR